MIPSSLMIIPASGVNTSALAILEPWSSGRYPKPFCVVMMRKIVLGIGRTCVLATAPLSDGLGVTEAHDRRPPGAAAAVPAVVLVAGFAIVTQTQRMSDLVRNDLSDVFYCRCQRRWCQRSRADRYSSRTSQRGPNRQSCRHRDRPRRGYPSACRPRPSCGAPRYPGTSVVTSTLNGR